jgi:hypothetical protein
VNIWENVDYFLVRIGLLILRVFKMMSLSRNEDIKSLIRYVGTKLVVEIHSNLFVKQYYSSCSKVIVVIINTKDSH